MGTKISIVENFLLRKSLDFGLVILFVCRKLCQVYVGVGKGAVSPQPYRTRFRFMCLVSCVNDPSAGSPTETLLRLLLPLSDKVYLTSRSCLKGPSSPGGSPYHSKSVGATGGVYKGQGRNQYKLMTCTY